MIKIFALFLFVSLSFLPFALWAKEQDNSVEKPTVKITPPSVSPSDSSSSADDDSENDDESPKIPKGPSGKWLWTKYVDTDSDKDKDEDEE